MNLIEYKEHFDVQLHLRLEQKLSSVQDFFPDEQSFELLTYLRQYVDLGKRFRPYMVYLRYSLYWWEDLEYITRIGIISEMIHIFALIHDDICDQGTSRHAIPTYHLKLAEKYQNPYTGDVQAMLVWDMVYTRALQEASIQLQGTEAMKIVYDMLNQVIVWQMLDIDYSDTDAPHRTRDEIMTKDHLKSGQYTFQKPMMIWVSLAWCKDLEQVEILGKKTWIAFQLRDDLLDRIPNNEGKTKMSDIQEGNQTQVLDICREEMSEEDFQLLRSSRWKKLSSEEQLNLQEIFDSYFLKEKVLEELWDQLDDVQNLFVKIDVEKTYAPYFITLLDLLRGA